MKFDVWVLLVGGAGTGLMAYAGASLMAYRNRGKQASRRVEERRTLAELSSLWTGREPVVHFKDIARIWRDGPQAEERKKTPRPAFRHPEIDTFFADWVENRTVLKGSKRAVIEAILTILDREGDCPLCGQDEFYGGRGQAGSGRVRPPCDLPLVEAHIGGGPSNGEEGDAGSDAARRLDCRLGTRPGKDPCPPECPVPHGRPPVDLPHHSASDSGIRGDAEPGGDRRGYPSAPPDQGRLSVGCGSQGSRLASSPGGNQSPHPSRASAAAS